MPQFEPNSEFTKVQLSGLASALTSEKYDYSYPHGLDLKPDSELHNRLRDYLMARAMESKSMMQEKYPIYEKIDRSLSVFVDLDENETEIDDDDERTPTSIVVPVSYASLDTLVTYTSARFLTDTIFRYEGTGTEPEDTLGAILLELTVDRQAFKANMRSELYTNIRSSYAYGMGHTAQFWTEEWGMRTVRQRRSIPNQLLSLAKSILNKENGFRAPKDSKKRVRTLLYEGSRLESIDPYKVLPDPHTPVQKLQEGEMFAYVSPTNFTHLLGEEGWNKALFNVKWLNHFDARSVLNLEDDYDVRQGEGMSDSDGERTTTSRPVDLLVSFCNIIPNELGLGSKKTPEKWIFLLAGDQVIVGASPLDKDHNLFPVVVGAPNYDGHTAVPISHMQVIFGMQKTMDWLIRSRMASVRKVVHNMMVLDPYLINYFDAKNPKGGKIILARPPARGRGILDKGIHQLKVQDVTTGHMVDMGYWDSMIKQVLATTDPVQGVPREHTGDISATEFEGTRVSAASRIENSANILGNQVIEQLAYMIAKDTQQFMSRDTYVKTVGDWEDTLREQYGVGDRMRVSPLDILQDFDVVSKMTSPKGGVNAQSLIQMFQVVAGSEILSQTFDVEKLAEVTFQELGIKSVGSFKRKTRILPDEQVAQGVEAGNFAPVGAV